MTTDLCQQLEVDLEFESYVYRQCVLRRKWLGNFDSGSTQLVFETCATVKETASVT